MVKPRSNMAEGKRSAGAAMRLAVMTTTTQNCGASEAAASHRIGAGGTWKLSSPRETYPGHRLLAGPRSSPAPARCCTTQQPELPAPLLLYRATVRRVARVAQTPEVSVVWE